MALLEEATFESDLSKLLNKDYERFIELFSRNLDCLFSLKDLRKHILEYEVDSFGNFNNDFNTFAYNCLKPTKPKKENKNVK